MLPLLESPGFCIIDTTEAGDGYWNYEEIGTHTVDAMQALQVMEPDIQQIHQYGWSSGHKKNKLGGLAISIMDFKFGGKGGK